MVIIEDTRQKINKHEEKHGAFSDMGVRVMRSKLIVGDYALVPSVSVDTKENISEIAANLCGSLKERKRFIRECKIAKDIGCELVFLIEDPRFENVLDLFGKNIWLMAGRTIPGRQLAQAMLMVSERYDVRFLFCKPSESAEYIKRILTERDIDG